MKLVCRTIISNCRKREREKLDGFSGFAPPGRFSTVDESFIAMVCPTQTVDPSLHRPWNRPTSRIIAPEISMVSPLSFVPVLLFPLLSLSLFFSFFFFFRKTKISTKDIIRYEFLKSWRETTWLMD